MFEEVAKGTHTVQEVWRMARRKGLQFSKSQVWNMLRNPIYCAKIFIPAYKDEAAVLISATHEPLVSERLFQDVQDILEGRKRKVPPKNTGREELPLRGFLECRLCGGRLTDSASKGNGGKYFYYHCTKGCPERFKAEEANELFLAELKKISANEESIALFEEMMESYIKASGKEKGFILKEIEAEIEKHKERIRNAQEMAADKKWSAED
jgi:site-specific DNA recombinase